MGQAKQRGSFEERRFQAIERRALAADERRKQEEERREQVRQIHRTAIEEREAHLDAMSDEARENYLNGEAMRLQRKKNELKALQMPGGLMGLGGSESAIRIMVGAARELHEMDKIHEIDTKYPVRRVDDEGFVIVPSKPDEESET